MVRSDQLSWAPVGAVDGGQMGRIRKTELKKITDAGGDASWDRVERSTKVGEVCAFGGACLYGS